MKSLFRIPGSFELLESEDASDFWTVENVYNTDQIPSKLREAEAAYKEKNTEFIFKHFDVFYSTIKHFNKLPLDIRENAWTLVHKALGSLYRDLSVFLSHFLMDKRSQYQNKMQMIVYAFTSLSILFENNEISCGGDSDDKNKSSRYSIHKQYACGQFLNILNLDLKRIFEPASFLNDFVSAITKYVYIMLENKNVTRSKNAVLFSTITDILSTAIANYDHSATFCMKLIDLIQARDSLVAVMSTLVSNIVCRSKSSALIESIISQVKSIDISLLSRDTSGPKAISSFIVDLSSKCPMETLESLPKLVEFLEKDSYLLRNATLDTIGNIIRISLAKSTKLREVHLKNKLFEILLEHIHDTTSFTRSRVLQVWKTLLTNDVIPKELLLPLTKLVIGRLSDKSCHVRRYALLLLTEIVKRNPYMLMNKAQLVKLLDKYEEIYKINKDNFDECTEKMKQLVDQGQSAPMSGDCQQNGGKSDDEISNESNEIDENEELCEKRKYPELDCFIQNKKLKTQFEDNQELCSIWFYVEDSFINYWKKNNHLLKRDEIVESIPDDKDKAFLFFRQLVAEKDFEQALKVMFSLQSLYPKEPVFDLVNQMNSDASDDFDDVQSDLENMLQDAISCFDKLFLLSIS